MSFYSDTDYMTFEKFGVFGGFFHRFQMYLFDKYVQFC